MIAPAHLSWRTTMTLRPTLLARSLLALAALAFATLAPGQTNDKSTNPEGNAGILKPQIGTAGGYDGHSGNGSRVVTDLKFDGVPGGGMDVVRHWNSIHSAEFQPFAGGGWSHSFAWAAQAEFTWTETDGDARKQHVEWITIVIHHPEGHTSRYKMGRPEVSPMWNYPWPTGWGWGDRNEHRLTTMDPNGASFRLEKSDGSTFLFEGNGAEWRVMQINDPHGLRTFFFYNPDGTLAKVVGPVPSDVDFSRASASGYRAVKFSYATYGSEPSVTVVDRIGIYETDLQSAPIQSAKYNYSYLTRSVSAPEGPVTTVSGWVLASVTYEDEVLRRTGAPPPTTIRRFAASIAPAFFRTKPARA